VAAALGEGVPTALPRAVLEHLAAALDALPLQANDLAEAAADAAAGRLRGRAAAAAAAAAEGGGGAPGGGGLEAAEYRLRYLLYRVYMGADDFLRAGAALGGAPLDAPGLPLGDAERALAYVKVAQAYLKGDDDVAADRFVRRAGELVTRGTPFAVAAQFRACYAAVLDAKRKFHEAALRYYELSTLRPPEGVELDEAELLAMLAKAARAACLAPAGPARGRLMGTLYRDERARGALDGLTFSTLERMYLERVVPPADAARFEATLPAHQRATTADGSTILARALVEHNLLAASRLYSSISFAALAALLGVEPAKAERVAARMVAEGRLAARLDQVDGFVDFAPGQPAPGAGAVGAAGAAGGGGAPGAPAPPPAGGAAGTLAALAAWDAPVKDVCLELNAITAAVAKAFPHLVPEGAF